VYKTNLKKIDLVKQLKIKTGFSSNFSKKLINDLIEILSEVIKTGYLNLKNIGSFKTINKKERMGRNPKTKEEFIVSSRKSISFIPSKKLLKNINKFL